MILESLIAITCAGLTGNGQDACIKALQASVKQTGVEQDMNKIEEEVSKQADLRARNLVGDTGMTAGAVVGGTGKAISEKSATLKFPAFAPSMFVSAQVSPTKSMLGLEWKY